MLRYFFRNLVNAAFVDGYFQPYTTPMPMSTCVHNLGLSLTSFHALHTFWALKLKDTYIKLMKKIEWLLVTVVKWSEFTKMGWLYWNGLTLLKWSYCIEMVLLYWNGLTVPVKERQGSFILHNIAKDFLPKLRGQGRQTSFNTKNTFWYTTCTVKKSK